MVETAAAGEFGEAVSSCRLICSQTGILKWSKQIDELSKTLPAPDKDSGT